MPEVAEKKNGQLHCCKLTIVDPGSSDRVIKIYPAEHEKEKIWLNEVRGVERWDMIQRNMNAFARKGTLVPKPAPYHNDPKNLTTITLTEENIPIVNLEGWVLPAPPVEEVAPQYRNDSNNVVAINERINALEKQLSAAIAALNATQGRPMETPVHVEKEEVKKGSVQCTHCNETFKNGAGLSAHTRKKHKTFIQKIIGT